MQTETILQVRARNSHQMKQVLKAKIYYEDGLFSSSFHLAIVIGSIMLIFIFKDLLASISLGIGIYTQSFLLYGYKKYKGVDIDSASKEFLEAANEEMYLHLYSGLTAAIVSIPTAIFFAVS